MKTVFFVGGLFCLGFSIYTNLKEDPLTGIVSGVAAMVLFALSLL